MLKKKILFILNLPPPIYGANMVGNFIRNSSLINNSFDVDFINLTTEKKLHSQGRLDFSKISLCIKLYWKVLFSLLRKRYDLCYVTINSKGSGFYKDFIVVIFLKLFRRNIVYHYHNKGVSEGKHLWWLNLMYKFQFRNCNAILLSPLLYSDVSKYLHKNNTYFCANGIPSIPGVGVKLLNIKREKKTVPHILFLSNMIREKGVFILLEACKILLSKNISFKMIFIGGWVDITEKEFNDYLLLNNLAKCVFYEGRKYGNQKTAFFENADIFVFPSFYHNEAFPLVNLEAMQHGLSVVSTREGGIPDQVFENETGYLVNKKDPVELSSKLQYLIENSDVRKQMGIAGKNKFDLLFTLDIFERNFTNILSQIISTNDNLKK